MKYAERENILFERMRKNGIDDGVFRRENGNILSSETRNVIDKVQPCDSAKGEKGGEGFS